MQGGALLWKRRSALLYTFGSWTVFGSILFYSSRYIQKREEEPQVPREEERSAVVATKNEPLWVQKLQRFERQRQDASSQDRLLALGCTRLKSTVTDLGKF
uniref:Uncharacterized protein n=1 Tax=Sphaerodactylus townsendi TaxID=933632 RepID=A0ACB8EBV3_9SAUR